MKARAPRVVLTAMVLVLLGEGELSLGLPLGLFGFGVVIGPEVEPGGREVGLADLLACEFVGDV